MTGRIITCDHATYDLPALLSWEVNYTGGVPCDSFTVSCLYDKTMAEPLHRAMSFLALAGTTVLLRGIVDECEISLSESGRLVTVSGRGYAARLLDNESQAATYQGASLSEIIRNHVTPYGISCQKIADIAATSVYTVASGASQWKALESFCLAYGGFSPRFSKEGQLIAAPEDGTPRCVRIDAGSALLSLTKRENHYGVLSEVLVIDKTRGVSYSVKSQDFLDRGGQCRRVLYTPGQSTYAAMRYTGEYQIAKSAADERTVELTLPGAFLAFPGEQVELALSRDGIAGTFRVAEAENRLSDAGETSRLTLKEKD